MPTNPAPPANNIRLANDATLGKILTDAEGRSLYFFSVDHTGESLLCVGDCIAAWPVFYTADLTLDEGLLAADFGTVTRADGTPQTTYKGWPLYYFVEDTEAGEVKGEAVNDVWFVAKPDYALMLAQAQLIGKDVNGNETLLNDAYEAGEGFTFYLTDDRGNTLYRFVNDTKGQNNYTEADFSNDALWPIFNADLTKVPSILNKDDFAQIDVHGRTQLTYKGWPLYTFQQDEKRGDNFGVGFPFPGVWPIANQNTNPATD